MEKSSQDKYNTGQVIFPMLAVRIVFLKYMGVKIINNSVKINLLKNVKRIALILVSDHELKPEKQK